VPFTFAYGPDSAARHAREAARRSLTVRILRDAALAFDVDTAADLDALDALRPTPAPTPTPTPTK
jgi:2-phospho-L-lactate guanylyltransferase (CobY/MobA/RfbA family)